MTLEELVKEATRGDKSALEGIVSAVQDDIYSLALRMLVNPDDAKDATQEIIVKVITNLTAFRFESTFKTWVYRVAANYLLTEKKVLQKDPGLTFDLYRNDLESDLQESSSLQANPEYQTLLNELRISCTMAMLLCLNPSHRIAYILGDIFEMEHVEASTVLSISKENFRKQLSRARRKVMEFTTSSCGLVSRQAKCRCERKISGAIKRQRIVPDRVLYSYEARFTYEELKESLLQTQQDLKTLALQNSVKYYKCPVELSGIIESLVIDGIKRHKALFPAKQ